MCLAIIGIKTHKNFPVFIAAYREENPRRKTTPPRVILDGKAVVAGIDEREGGSWLGLNYSGMVLALANRREKVRGKKASRDLLLTEALKAENFEQLQSLLKKTAKKYTPFNLFYSNAVAAFVSSWNGKRLITQRLTSGYYVLTALGLNDPKDPRVRRALELVNKQQETALPQDILPLDWRDLFFQFIQILKDHEPDKPREVALCRHDKMSRTVGSSLLTLANRGASFGYFWHLSGSPCEASYKDYTTLLKKLMTPSVSLVGN